MIDTGKLAIKNLRRKGNKKKATSLKKTLKKLEKHESELRGAMNIDI